MTDPIYSSIIHKQSKLAVIGLGYVGLPIALAFARHCSVVGFDINQERVEQMKQGIDPSRELLAADFEGCDILFTHNSHDLHDVRFFVVAVPTPVDEHRVPNLKPLISASRTVGSVLKKGDYVIYESTVYPGCTEDDCVPVLEQVSGLRYGTDFKVGYSPERINPGDTEHTLSSIVKVVSGCDAESLDQIAKVYELIIAAGIHRAASIKVAEAAKVIENTQRDLNIALMNELALIFDKMDINTQDVLAAARTKWNFLPFAPGLVGGHCIGVDPYYLTYKSTELGYKPDVILSGRRINDEMSLFIAKRVIQYIIRAGKHLSQSRVLVMGATFKENVSDIRNSKVVDLVRELQAFSISVDISDPHALPQDFAHEYNMPLLTQIPTDILYDAIVVAVKHNDYAQFDEAFFEKISAKNGILIDIKGAYRGQIKHLKYWTL
jgi:UDP-N-acetyl-D-galactosamine dehydrogenase